MIWRRWNFRNKPHCFTVDLAQRRYTLKEVFRKRLCRDFWGSTHYLIVVEQEVEKPTGGKCGLCDEMGVRTPAFVEAALRLTDEEGNSFEKHAGVCAYHALSRHRRYVILKKAREYAAKGYGEYTCSDLENIRTFVPESMPPWNTIRTEALVSAPELRGLFGNRNWDVEVKHQRKKGGRGEIDSGR